jgi:hypothetical protein
MSADEVRACQESIESCNMLQSASAKETRLFTKSKYASVLRDAAHARLQVRNKYDIYIMIVDIFTKNDRFHMSTILFICVDY